MKKSTHIRMPYKMFSLVMAFLIISSSVPFAFAATTLTSSNVTQWPTLSYKSDDGKMYFGQTLSDGLIINDDEIVLDENGNQVAGHFEFIEPTLIPSPCTDAKSHIQFVPDNADEYTGFQKKRSSLLYSVETVTPVFVDEVNDPVVATEVEAGTTLSTSTLSGGKMTNPYNPEEPEILERTWEWLDPYIVVNESGYYEAVFMPAGYTTMTTQVYVRVAGEIPETTITEAPTVPTDLKYDGVTTWGDIPLEGGKAELKVEGTAVEGAFAVTDYWKTRTVNPGSYEIDVVFTPADPEAALPYSLKIPVTVNKGQMKFVDESGNEIVPEITVEYGTTFGDIHYYLESYVAGDDAVSIGMVGIENANKTLCKDGTYTASLINRTDSNYERTELPFKIVIKRKTLTPKLTVAVGSDGLIIRDSSGNYSPKGTFTLEYTIDGVPQEPITGIKYETAFEFNYNKSGNYEYTIIYNEAEVDEYFIIDDFTTSNPIFLTWKFSATGSVDGEYKYGDEVKLEAPATDPAKEDKPFYGFVKWEDANGNTGLTEEELSNREISFAMPDGDVDLDATYKFDFCLCIRYYIQIVVDWFNSFFQSIGTLF
ncbi:MAG: hypothetical protein U0M02_00495 [Acutalibacteraceae bacterium]|nr:hypothetical protein [Acutalibacteraceae bacterium]